VVCEGSRFACGQLVFAHKQMDVDAQSGVADDLLAALAARVGGVLALPVKVAVSSPVVYVLMRVSTALQKELQVICLFNRSFG
jgi:hypothetical protein